MKISSFLTLLFLASSPATQGIVGSVHDFTPSGVNIPVDRGTGEICIVCHTPHSQVSKATTNAGPLWNHELTTTTFTLYSSSDLNASLGQPNGSSKLCLSCHDSTVALDSWGGYTGTLFMKGHRIDLKTDLSDDHPVSFRYDSALAVADKGLKDPATTPSGIGSTILADLLDDDSRLQCTSCHDIHNKMGNGNYRGARYGLLWKRNTGSQLCLTCHDK